MTSDVELLLSVLAMDSYNHGYEVAVTDIGPSLGSATVLKLESLGIDYTKQTQWAAAGFSATAYRLTGAVGDLPTGTVVISYRGTDSLAGRNGSLWGGKLPTDGDVLNGYGLAGGLPTASQTAEIADIALKLDDFDSLCREQAPATAAAATLPELRGHGTLADLRQVFMLEDARPDGAPLHTTLTTATPDLVAARGRRRATFGNEHRPRTAA